MSHTTPTQNPPPPGQTLSKRELKKLEQTLRLFDQEASQQSRPKKRRKLNHKAEEGAQPLAREKESEADKVVAADSTLPSHTPHRDKEDFPACIQAVQPPEDLRHSNPGFVLPEGSCSIKEHLMSTQYNQLEKSLVKADGLLQIPAGTPLECSQVDKSSKLVAQLIKSLKPQKVLSKGKCHSKSVDNLLKVGKESGKAERASKQE